MKCMHRLVFAAAVALLPQIAMAQSPPGDFPVNITVNAAQSKGTWRPIWRFFGADEPNYAYMTHGEELIRDMGELAPRQVFFRTHNLLTSGDGTPALKWGSTNIYTEDAAGNPVYDFTIVDRIFDTYLKHGVRPYAQIGFMPEAMSTRPQPYKHEWDPTKQYNAIYTGWAYPPKDYKKWEELSFQWVKHCIERYSKEEVETWYWECWNEPNIQYWRGTPEEFRKTHDYAINGVRRALPTAKVGGADTAGSGGQFSRDFFEHCLRGTNFATGEKGTPLDFVSFHAKGSPTNRDGHVVMGISNQLRAVNDGFGIVASFPELKNTPIVIGESDPEGCAACQGPQLAYRNGTMYSSYTAASFARKLDLADRHGVNFEGALTWAFEFEPYPYFAGFRSLATNGVNKPVFNVFRMYSKMGLKGERISAESDSAVSLDTMLQQRGGGVREKPDVAALANRGENQVAVMVWHYHDEDIAGPVANVSLKIGGLAKTSGPALLRHYRIDEKNSNSFAAWQAMGSPQEPSKGQYAELRQASELAELNPPKAISLTAEGVSLNFPLPRKGVSLVVVSWE